MLRTSYWMIYFWCYLITRIPLLSRIDKMDKTSLEYKDIVEKNVKHWSQSLVRLTKSNVTVIGEENIPSETSVFVSNHQGNFDVPLMLGYVGKPRSVLAKIELSKMPWVRDWMTHLGCIFVDRKDDKQSLKAVMQAIKYVKDGNSMSIFPEGTRSRSNEMNDFKPGSTRIAIKGNALIVPVTIDGSYKILEKNKGFKITPADVKITIHKPINPKTLSKEEISDIDNIIKNIISSKLK